MFRKIMIAGLVAVLFAGASISSAARDFLSNREKSSASVSQENETTKALEESTTDTTNQESTTEPVTNLSDSNMDKDRKSVV